MNNSIPIPKKRTTSSWLSPNRNNSQEKSGVFSSSLHSYESNGSIDSIFSGNVHSPTHQPYSSSLNNSGLYGEKSNSSVLLVPNEPHRMSTSLHGSHDQISQQHGVLNLHSIIKNRSGSVLSRKTILKSDHFEKGVRTNVEFFLQGAPNFRAVDDNIYGVAQPTVSGISTVLSLLKCKSGIQDQQRCVWFSAREEPMIYINRRPFVLRDEDTPLSNIKRYQGIHSSRLEQMEQRLKEDILNESKKFNGLLLIHDELDDGRVIPMWTSVDTVQTPRDIFQEFQLDGCPVKYLRIPISPEQAPDDKYIDEYYSVIRNTPLDASLVFNCGIGVGRTTFAMTLATLIRRAQKEKTKESEALGISFDSEFDQSKNQINLLVNESDEKNRALLRLVYILDQGLKGHGVSHSAIDWALARSPIIDDLKNAVLGNYRCILQLVSVLSNGNNAKSRLDQAINHCDKFVNIREEILRHRISFSVSGLASNLDRAMGWLERYFNLLVFSAFVTESDSEETFHEWITARPEIVGMFEYLKKKSNRLHLFRPVEDLSVFSGSLSRTGASKASELEKFVIKSRKGTVLVHHTILKIDHWSLKMKESSIAGAANFRKIPDFEVYGVAQPTIQGIRNVLNTLPAKNVVWINLREEPLIYVNGSAYVLRDKYFTLRNIKAYSGITSARLQFLEEKLKEDVISELASYEGRVLLHGETQDDEIVATWEDADPLNVQTIHEIMQSMQTIGYAVELFRVPVTAETPPDIADFDHILALISKKASPNSAFVVNCQVGQGRSTTGTVIACLVLNWLNNQKKTSVSSQSNHYQVIHSLMRVIKNGLECKLMVDSIIDQCSSVINLRQSIEDSRLQAEKCADNDSKYKRALKTGMTHLKRYFMLIVFQCYLNETSPDAIEDLESFEHWFKRHPELELMKDELRHDRIEHLIPVEQQRPGDGIALTTEVLQVVSSRNGGVLAAQTILKYDMFPGCQKLTLPERVEGAPNYRRVQLDSVKSLTCSDYKVPASDDDNAFVYGVAMPTTSAIRNVLQKVNAGPLGTRKLLWTCLREEPVLYVNGRPFVLRLFQDATKNLEATGIARDRVENMELQMKKDAIAELVKYNGRLLLHEEFADGNTFSILPVWETVEEKNIQTPLEVYESILAEGYYVDYLRLPITDEQAPIPDVFDQLVSRLMVVGETERIDAMFNCQMGRGRTTTGMIITCLMQMIVGNTEILKASSDLYKSIEELRLNDNAEENDILRYQKGEYKIILQLISVLQYGKISKKLTDKAIDACEQLQNLRVAIYDYKLRIEACEIGSKKHQNLLHIGLNYLVRYFYLITFADYLLEVMTLNRSRLQFSDWLSERQEILNLVHPSNQSLE